MNNESSSDFFWAVLPQHMPALETRSPVGPATFKNSSMRLSGLIR